MQTNCEYVANGLQQCGDIRRIRGEHSANTWRTNCNNATFKKQKPYFCNSKTPFCTSKTILLHVKNHTFVMRICNIQKTNTLRTFHKCVANTHEIGCEHSARRRGPIADALRTNCQTLLTVCQNAAKHAASFGTPHNNAPTYKHKKTYKIYNRI